MIRSTLGRLAGAGPLALAALLAAMGPALAQEKPAIDSGDTAWMLTSTALVLMMSIPGVALFYGGMVRKKNVLATMMQTFAVCCVVTIVWVVIGYSLAFDAGNDYIGGLGKMMMSGVMPDSVFDPALQKFPESVFSVYQMTFAIITVALVFGGVADRMKFSAVLLFAVLWTIFCYAPIAKWVWGGGFLGAAGVLDFAGGTVVHINAGVAGLVAAIVLGKRAGYGKEHFAPHNLTLVVIGGALLWVGWFGFNAGSATSASPGAGYAMLVTQIAAAAAGLAWMLAEWMVKGKPSVLGIVSGVVAGLVGITPAAGFVGVGGALIIGIVSGFVCYWGATGLKNALGYDDSLDAFGIHGVGGIVGAILTGVFAVQAIGGEGKSGLIDGNAGQVVLQLFGVGVTIVYTAIVTFIVLKVIDLIVGLRVDVETERDGLDLKLHGETVQ